MDQILSKQIRQIELQEQKFLNQPESKLMQNTISPVLDMLQDKIPDKLKDTLNIAFYKGFQLVFDQGTEYIEKTYNKDKIQLEYDINDYAVNKKNNKKHMTKLDHYSKQTKLINSSFSILEGGVLGFLGIGIPDIPLFIAVLMKTLYETALSYGYLYETPQEKAYLLLTINSAISKGELQKDYNSRLEQLGQELDHGINKPVELEVMMRSTSNHLADALLTAKFIQGIPVVGVIGGAVNYNMVNRVAKYAGLKYKKRYLLKKASM